MQDLVIKIAIALSAKQAHSLDGIINLSALPLSVPDPYPNPNRS